MHAIGHSYQSHQAPSASSAVTMALYREQRRNRSLRKMVVAQTIYAAVVTAAWVAVEAVR